MWDVTPYYDEALNQPWLGNFSGDYSSSNNGNRYYRGIALLIPPPSENLINDGGA